MQQTQPALPPLERRSLLLRSGRQLSYILLGAPLPPAPQQHHQQKQQQLHKQPAAHPPAAPPPPPPPPPHPQHARQQQLQQQRPAIIYHHGWPSSAIEAAVYHQPACQHSFSVVAIDRPGSSFIPAGSFASYADAVGQLLDHLQLDRVVHVGCSGGGPFACACAALPPTAATTAGLRLVAGMTHCAGPGSEPLLAGMDAFDRLGHSCIARAPGLVRLAVTLAAPFLVAAPAVARLLLAGLARGGGSSSSSSQPALEVDPPGASTTTAPGSAGVLAAAAAAAAPGAGMLTAVWRAVSRGLLWALASALPAPDRTTLLAQPPYVLALLPRLLADSVATGSARAALTHDMTITTLPWQGFSLADIRVASVVVWQGDEDCNVPLAMGRHLAGHIPGAQLRVVRGAGHLSLVLDHAPEVMAELAADVRLVAAAAGDGSDGGGGGVADEVQQELRA